MISALISAIALAISTLTFSNAFTIASDHVTNWGVWGEWDRCPSGSFVKAINIKVEGQLGGGHADDTAMNAVHLSCVRYEDQVTNVYKMKVTKTLKSKEGPWGEFKGTEVCYEGIAVGFILRVEEKQSGWQSDNTATNDMKLICQSAGGFSKTVAKGQTWGKWGSEKNCPKGMAVCGLRTQIEPRQNSGDDSALNNVELQCCKMPVLASTCTPSDKWQNMATRDNSGGTTSMKYTFKKKLGVQKTQTSQQSGAHTDTFSLDLEAGYKGLAWNFQAKLGMSETTQHSWSSSDVSAFSEETEETIEFEIPAKCKMTLEQIIGSCGPYLVQSNSIRRTDNCDNKKTVTIVP